MNHWTKLADENKALRAALALALESKTIVASRFAKERACPSVEEYSLGYVAALKEIDTRLTENHSAVSDVLVQAGVTL